MSGNTERFSGRVKEYLRFRSAYPAEKILRWLEESCELDRSWRVADVAAGTGMLTEVFLGNGNEVVALEPNAEMRAACEGVRARWPGLQVREGTAEQTGLMSASMRMVAAGRAFHWFDPVRAAAEFERVLVPGGWVVLVSSGRKRDDSERGAALEQMMVEHGTDPEYAQRRATGLAGAAEFLRRLGHPESYAKVSFEAARQLGLEEFRGTVQSISCAPLPGDPRYPGMQAALEAFFARWSEDGVLRMVEVCSVEVGRV